MVIPIGAIIAGIGAASDVANVIQTAIVVNDALTPTLESYSSQLDTLDAQTTDWLAGFNVPVPGSVLDGVKSAADYIKQAVFDAAQMQTSMIASASDLATNLKIPVNEALKVVENSQVAIANIAAALPGETAGYADIYRSLSGTLSKQFQGDEFKQQSEEFTKRIGILAAIRGADASSAGSASNRLLAGTSGIGEAVVQDIFQRNPALYSALLEQLQEQKVDPDDWKKIKQEVRTKIFSNALAKAAPDSLIEAFEGTFQGTYETIKTQLFDPISGLLGVMRKVDTQGGITVLDAVNNIFQTLNRLKDGAIAALKGLGYNLDPFHYLIEFFVWINDTIGELLLVGVSTNPVEGFKKWIADLPNTIGQWIIDTVKFFSGVIKRFLDSGLDGANIGSLVGQFMNSFDQIKLRVLENIDIKQIAELYFRISKEIADLQGAIWWEGVKAIPTRIAIWVDMWLINLQLGFVPIRVAFVKFTDMMLNIINALIAPLEAIINPISYFSKVANDLNGAIPTAPAIQLPDSSGLKQAALSAVKVGLNPVGAVQDIGINAIKSIFQPKPKQQGNTTNNTSKKTAFAPTINVNGAGVSDPQELANMVMDEILSAYSAFTENSLA